MSGAHRSVPSVSECFVYMLSTDARGMHAFFRSRQGSKRRRINDDDETRAADAGEVQSADPAERKKTAMQKIINIMQDKEQLSLGDLISEANTVAPVGQAFTKDELVAALSALDNDNKIMFYDDMVHKV